MPWPALLTPFAEKLYELIARRRLTVRGFAERAGTSQSTISQIKSRRRPPPLKQVEHWADILEIRGDEREYFLDLAALACAPERVLRMFEPGHPAQKAIRAAIERDVTTKRAAEEGVAYEAKPPKRTRSGR